MKPARCLKVLLLALPLTVTGCSSREIYQSGLGWRQNECQKILESAERARCLETANMDYESYSRERTAPPQGY